MGLNIKNPEVERLADEVARLTGETKTEAIRIALLQRKAKLAPTSPEAAQAKIDRWNKVWEEEIRPRLDPSRIGTSMSKVEREEILGIGPDGY